MRKFCGRKLRVYRRADKVCVDTGLFWIRRMRNAVLLEESFCDGAAHDGCTRMCRVFWKEAWLERASTPEPGEMPFQAPPISIPALHSSINQDASYSCQSTRLFAATEPLRFSDIRQYVRDFVSGNFTIAQILKAIYIALYNQVKGSKGGIEFGGATGNARTTPAIALNLQPGDLVEVKTRDEITPTIDARGRNRGLTIDFEMMRHAGHQFRVLRRVDRMILESNGTMKEIKNTVLLENVTCEGLCRRACARGSFPMWREAWLKRIEESSTDVQSEQSANDEQMNVPQSLVESR
jgi:hypothetical protein